jgi:hypothetical protein
MVGQLIISKIQKKPSGEQQLRIDEIINEGYKEATAEFTTASNDKAEVDKIIAQYRELVNRNQVKGDEKILIGGENKVGINSRNSLTKNHLRNPLHKSKEAN